MNSFKKKENNNPILEIKYVPNYEVFKKDDFFIYAGTTWDTEVETNSKGNVSIKGKMQELQLGIEYKAKIQLDKVDPNYGASYNVLSIYQDIPDNQENQRYYLSTMMTDNQLKALLVRHGSEDVIQLFRDNKIDYKNIYGWSEKRYNKIRKKIMESLDYRDMFVYLGKYEISHDIIKKLIGEFGSAEKAIHEINKDVYALTRVPGIGFKKADGIAMSMGLSREDKGRIRAAIRHVIGENEINGDTYMIVEEMISVCQDLLKIDPELIREQINQVEGTVLFDERIARRVTYNAEHNIATKIRQMADRESRLDIPMAEFLFKMEQKYKKELPSGFTDEQREFFFNFKEHAVNILAGSGGTGKTAMQKIIQELAKHLKMKIKYLSPTGKAAKVLSKYTGVEAYTIHRAIGYGRNVSEEESAQFELHDDILVIDEWSMVDVFLCSALLDAIKNPNVRIIMVGDNAQIASVNAGNILHDMINSGVVWGVELTKVWRQDEGGILDIATRIRKGQTFLNNTDHGKNNFGKNLIVHCVDGQHIESGYLHYYNLFKKEYSPEDIMVLSPTKKNNLGTIRINKLLQQINNPDEGQKQLQIGEDSYFRIGDYVMNTKNEYSASCSDGFKTTTIVNGDTGYIYDIVSDWNKKDAKTITIEDDDEIEQSDMNGIYVDFGFEKVIIPFDSKNNLMHAWAISKHKSQGSSSKAVILILDKAHKFMGNRNLLYTGMTRATEKEVLLTQAETVNFVMRKQENYTRKTLLQEMLREEL